MGIYFKRYFNLPFGFKQAVAGDCNPRKPEVSLDRPRPVLKGLFEMAAGEFKVGRAHGEIDMTETEIRFVLRLDPDRYVHLSGFLYFTRQQEHPP